MDKPWPQDGQREAAKIAMTISMDPTVFSAPYVHHGRTMRLAHTFAGLALMASSVWQNALYSVRGRSVAARPLLAPESAPNQAEQGEGMCRN
ncbi:MAG: hypothetical protein GX087_05455 [Desulfobulbaceae bacterium]|nr:hypothetical protein [Desulfobulbaceae bacterium]